MSVGLQRYLIPYIEAGLAVGYRSKSAIYQAAKDGLFIRPVHTGKHANAPSHEAQAIADARIAGKSADEVRALVAELHAKRTEAA